ncbi:MAG TPA: sigma-70 family RNA polymerase sigma factor [Planctomycetaceae bacterium]|nr:sigma-70 family RNA polymerase sigma factor [Planctomycetaceae bacterium]
MRALDPQAWETLSRLYGPLVYRWARQCGLQPQDAADVAQNVFVSILRGIARFSIEGPQATFRGWLWTITRNAVREFARKEGRHPVATGGSEAQHTLLELPAEDELKLAWDQDVLPNLTHRALRIVRESTEPHNWEAFWRTTALGESAVEVAEALQMTPPAVRQAKYRVLCRLRDLLADA